MRRGYLPSVVAATCLMVSCGGNSSNSTTTSLPDVKEGVRRQLDAIVSSYVSNMTTQIPTITSKISAGEITSCAKQRINQMIDASQIQENQPESQFAEMLLGQAQSSLYSIISACAQTSG